MAAFTAIGLLVSVSFVAIFILYEVVRGIEFFYERWKRRKRKH